MTLSGLLPLAQALPPEIRAAGIQRREIGEGLAELLTSEDLALRRQGAELAASLSPGDLPEDLAAAVGMVVLLMRLEAPLMEMGASVPRWMLMVPLEEVRGLLDRLRGGHCGVLVRGVSTHRAHGHPGYCLRAEVLLFRGGRQHTYVLDGGPYAVSLVEVHRPVFRHGGWT